ncbi:MAG: hypothetical protein DRP64_00795 [Verrucomicrobia bacterium]|nr:MAG: hypothetical protein DRP64_00795 [Verrucomicrobiota bacterium]
MSENQVEYGSYAGFLSDWKGFSVRNIWRMRSFYIAHGEGVIKLPTALAQIPWAHNILLVEKVKDPAARLWYMQQIVEHGWRRATLRRSHFRRMLLFWGRSSCWIQWCQLLAPTERRPPLLVRNREYAAI